MQFSSESIRFKIEIIFLNIFLYSITHVEFIILIKEEGFYLYYRSLYISIYIYYTIFIQSEDKEIDWTR